MASINCTPLLHTLGCVIGTGDRSSTHPQENRTMITSIDKKAFKLGLVAAVVAAVIPVLPQAAVAAAQLAANVS
jgi:hypothetical protein